MKKNMNPKKKLLLIISTVIRIPCSLSLTNLTIFPNTVEVQGTATVSWIVEDGDPTSLNLQFTHGTNTSFPGISSVNNINPHASSSTQVTVRNFLSSIGRYHFNVSGVMVAADPSVFTQVNSNALSVSGIFGSPPPTPSSSSRVPTTTPSTPSSTTTSTANPNASDRSPAQAHSTPIGAIIGGTVGGLGAIAIVIFTFICLQRRRNKPQNDIRRSQPFSIDDPPPQIHTRQTGTFALAGGAREEMDYGPVRIDAPRWDVEIVPPTYERVFPSSQSDTPPTGAASVSNTTQSTGPRPVRKDRSGISRGHRVEDSMASIPQSDSSAAFSRVPEGSSTYTSEKSTAHR